MRINLERGVAEIVRPLALGLASVAAFCIAPGVSAQPAEEGVVGLWSVEVRDTHRFDAPLTLVKDGERFHILVGSETVPGENQHGQLRFVLPGGSGVFRVSVPPDGEQTAGFWIEPPADFGSGADAGSFGQPFATPIPLTPAGSDRWQGSLIPTGARFRLYLKIWHQSDGSLLAVFRNPELNSRGGASQFKVMVSGENLHFTAASSGSDAAHDAVLLQGPERIHVAWPELGQTLDLRRDDADRSGGFYPRPPGASAYEYRVPTAGRDGWEVARANSVGIDESALAGLVRSIASADPAAVRPNLVHSVLVARHGKLVLNEYFHGFDIDTPHDLRSAAKTFSSVLLGAEMRRGAAVSPEARIYTLLADLGPFAHPDLRKANITLADLMTHSAGLACDDNDDASPGNEDTMQRQRAQPDWWKYTLDLPMAHDPGARYAYGSANINLVGGALVRSSGLWLPELFARDVAGPLQFGRWYWNLMPNGEGYLGGGALIRPRDLLKIGQIYLDGGLWRGQRIFDASWTTTSTKPRIEVTPATTGLSPADFANFYVPGADGLAWHAAPVDAGGHHYDGYAATGNGGQLLIILPALDLVVVFTGGNYQQGGIWGRWREQYVGGIIVPAVVPDASK